MRTYILKILIITLILVPSILQAETFQHCNDKLDALLHSSKYKTDIYTGKTVNKVLLDQSTNKEIIGDVPRLILSRSINLINNTTK